MITDDAFEMSQALATITRLIHERQVLLEHCRRVEQANVELQRQLDALRKNPPRSN